MSGHQHDHGHDHQHEFDKAYWERHWREDRPADPTPLPANPYLESELADLTPGTALDAGCGAGAEAIWLAAHGWRVTAADISAEALGRAAGRAAAAGVDGVGWVEADLSSWTPATSYDLVTTHYAHPAIPQLDFYDRLAGWVAPGGTLLVVGHLHGHHQDHGHGDQPPDAATATAASVTARLDGAVWEVVTAEELARTVDRPGGAPMTLHDVVVRATRRT